MGKQLTSARKRLSQAADILGLEDEILMRLSYPRETLAASLPIRRDDGTFMALKAWRCRYDDTLGPTKGGIRFHPEVSQDEIMTLAFWMTLKCALVGLPFGGGKGGVAVDSSRLSNAEKEQVARNYVRAFSAVIGPERDIPAPDIYTDARVMAWMMDEYQTIVRAPVPSAVTGKPVELGGSAGRVSATGLGGWMVLDTIKQELEIDPHKTRIAIQGFGNSAFHFAKKAADEGYRIVGVADSKSARIAPDGMDPTEVKAHKDKNGSVEGAPVNGKGQDASPESVLTMDCDILVPAALGNQITCDNANDIQARLILELANGPVSSDADDHLKDCGIKIIPDILANAGGVTVSYYEWLQNRNRESFSEATVNERLIEAMRSATRRVAERAEEQDINLRCAAYVVALDRIASAIKARGTEAIYAC